MNFASSFLPNGRVAFHHAEKSVTFTRKEASGPESSNEVSLAELCKESTPSTCRLNPFLFNGHLQTAWTVVKNDDVPVYYKRWTFESVNPTYSGSFDVDFVVPPYDSSTSAASTARPESNDTDSTAAPAASSEDINRDLPERTTFFTEKEFESLPSDDSKPMLIVLHGLSGGSHELYLRHTVQPLVQQGWEACVVNFRGCAQSKLSSTILYNARATWDIRQFVRWAREKFPSRPFFGIGFSLGANILTNYLGEEGDKCEFKAAVICSNPWNLDLGSHALQRSWIGLEVYSRTMGTNMKRLFESHVDIVRKHPRINVERIRNITYLHEFDREVQAPVWGYPTEGAYYRDASSIDSIFAIKVPFFVIQAEDDPISVKEALPYLEMKHTPYGVMCTTSWGGHLSWFELGGGRWFTKPVTKFLHKMATEIDLSVPLKVEDELRVVPSANTEAAKVAEADGPIPDFEPMRRKQQLPR